MGLLINPGSPGAYRGKVGHLVYSLQKNGDVTVRGVGTRESEPTEGELKGQSRWGLGGKFMQAVLAHDSELREAYVTEAMARKVRVCDLIQSDYMKDPVITSIDATRFKGSAGDPLLVVTGDDFKVVNVRIDLRGADGQELEKGLAVPAAENHARVWVYTAQKDLTPGQALTIKVTAVDRPDHLTVATLIHPI